MTMRRRTWAIVLAAGDGTRLAKLTTDAQGVAIPKQYCSLNGGHSLLQAALKRARKIVPRERIAVIVAEQHRRFWESALWSLEPDNLIVQPRNCGTANGVLLATLRILERDPFAQIVFLPADHHARDERLLGRTLRRTADLLTRDANRIFLVGIEPEDADPELGYIVPGSRGDDGARAVLHFVEKPDGELARQLVAAGAVWNSFVFAAHGATLLAQMRARLPEIVDAMFTAIASDAQRGAGPMELTALYERLPTVDFSRAVLQGAERALCVVVAPACGWSDLGTPKRVADVLRRLEPPEMRAARAPRAMPACINLASQHALTSLAG